jgi:hypothetical protein
VPLILFGAMVLVEMGLYFWFNTGIRRATIDDWRGKQHHINAYQSFTTGAKYL